MTRDLEYGMCLLAFRTLNSGIGFRSILALIRVWTGFLSLSVVLSYASLPFITS